MSSARDRILQALTDQGKALTPDELAQREKNSVKGIIVREHVELPAGDLLELCGPGTSDVHNGLRQGCGFVVDNHPAESRQVTVEVRHVHHVLGLDQAEQSALSSQHSEKS